MQVGIDIESVDKFKRIIEGINFKTYSGVLNSVFSPEEIEYCHNKKKPAQHFAVRYAGKEALLKALGTGLSGEIIMSDIAFSNDYQGKPEAKCIKSVKCELKKRNIKKINVSFSHNKQNAVAVVVLEE